jgi:hypothetical protein
VLADGRQSRFCRRQSAIGRTPHCLANCESERWTERLSAQEVRIRHERGEALMKAVIASRSRVLALALTLAFGQAGAWPASAAPGNTGGPSALALAGVVASHSSVLGSYGRRAMARLFSGHSAISFPPNRKISVTADSVMCRGQRCQSHGAKLRACLQGRQTQPGRARSQRTLRHPRGRGRHGGGGGGLFVRKHYQARLHD